MSAVKSEILRVARALPDDKARVVLEFARWLAEKPEPLPPRDRRALRRGEAQIAKGDYAWWRDARRT